MVYLGIWIVQLGIWANPGTHEPSEHLMGCVGGSSVIAMSEAAWGHDMQSY